MEDKLVQKLGNANYYLVAFVVSFIAMYGFALAVEFGAIIITNHNIPGFMSEYFNAAKNGLPLSNSMYMVQNLTQLLSQVLLSVVLILFTGKTLISDFKNFKKDIKYNILSIVLGFIIMIVVSSGVATLYDLLKIQGTAGNQNSILNALNSSTRVLMIISVIFFAPFVEEILFRKLLFGVSEKRLNLPKVVAVFVSAILFAAMHDINIFIFQYIALALVLCGSYAIFKNNIYIPMGIHFLNNLWMTIVALLL